MLRQTKARWLVAFYVIIIMGFCLAFISAANAVVDSSKDADPLNIVLYVFGLFLLGVAIVGITWQYIWDDLKTEYDLATSTVEEAEQKEADHKRRLEELAAGAPLKISASDEELLRQIREERAKSKYQ